MRRALLAMVLLTGCSKDEPAPASAPASASASASAPAPAPASASASASAPVSASASAPAPAPPPATKCGDKSNPCPLQGWMKAHTSAAMTAVDFDALTVALDQTVIFAPPGYPNWASIARDGADAARAQSLDGVKASCRGCHGQYRDRYRLELRERPISP